MNLQWMDLRIKDIGEVVTGKTPSSNSKHHFGDFMPFVTPTDFDSYHKYVTTAERSLSEEGAEALHKKILPSSSVIVTCIGSQMGKVAFTGVQCVTNQQINAIICDQTKVDPHFIYYSMVELYPLLRRMAADGTTMPIVNKSDFENILLRVPPLPIQKRIAEILGRLDDKIEVNRRINRTLEAMAQALYKHWFVDFGPFQDGPFVDSELGPIPEGWGVKRLDEVARINPSAIRKGEEPNDIIYIDIASVSPGHINEYTPMLFAEAPSRARRLVEHGDTIWSGVRPGRRSFSLIQHPARNLVVSTGFIVNRPLHVPYTYLYSFLSTQEFTDYLERRATGAAYPAVRSTDFDEALIVVPSKTILDRFHIFTDPWFEQRHVLNREEQQLASIRDFLLPRLLSGEIYIDVVEQQTS